MERDDLLRTVLELTWGHKGELICPEPGHAEGHRCLVPPGESSPAGLVEELDARYGGHRVLVAEGRVDPAVTDRTGRPLLAPYGEQVAELSAWACAARWIGCGTVRTARGPRVVVVVAGRTVPGPEAIPEGGSWVDRIIAVTGGDTDRPHAVDWSHVEARIGTPLPADYKHLVETFGHGAFDGYFSPLAPGTLSGADGIERRAETLARSATTHGEGMYAPHRLFPAPGGLLQWAGTEHQATVYWLTDGSDPDRWPILSVEDDYREWDRFDGSTGEFVFRLLTDPAQPHSTAQWFDTHWFMTHGVRP
ncbi:SMI1/KNR4 family protein [Actinacidiphila rubida]|uniref:Uncharacterized protein n=1 Tax=Actinacidiphila rubida TaxID=310780 RepID=A0A1H8EKA3_9ACTN|nr:SMI1/KNR4 family protein [Actinacidiphila rubida]SEN19919.1 hypothetical protein SAMN05216267_1002254 [Actinacidiphila rubida]